MNQQRQIFILFAGLAAALFSCRQADSNYQESGTVDSGKNSILVQCPSSPERAIAGIQLLQLEIQEICIASNQKIPGASAKCPSGCILEKKMGISQTHSAPQIALELNSVLRLSAEPSSSGAENSLAVSVNYTLPSQEKWSNMSCENPVHSNYFQSNLIDYLKIKCGNLVSPVKDNADYPVYSSSAKDLGGPIVVNADTYIETSGKCGNDFKEAVLKSFTDNVLKTSNRFLIPAGRACPHGQLPSEIAIQIHSSNQSQKPTISAKFSTTGTLTVGLQLGGVKLKTQPQNDQSTCLVPQGFGAYREFEVWLRSNWTSFLAQIGCPVVEYPD